MSTSSYYWTNVSFALNKKCLVKYSGGQSGKVLLSCQTNKLLKPTRQNTAEFPLQHNTPEHLWCQTCDLYSVVQVQQEAEAIDEM